MTRDVILRADGLSDAIAGQVFASHDETYTILKRYYADFCCCDDRDDDRNGEEAGAPV